MVVLKCNRVRFNDFFSLCILFKEKLSCRKCWSNTDRSMSFSKRRIYQTNCWLMDPFLPCLVEKWVVSLPMFINFYTGDICLTLPFPLFFLRMGRFPFIVKFLIGMVMGQGRAGRIRGIPSLPRSRLGGENLLRVGWKDFVIPNKVDLTSTR